MRIIPFVLVVLAALGLLQLGALSVKVGILVMLVVVLAALVLLLASYVLVLRRRRRAIHKE